MILPEEFVMRMTALLGADAPAFFAAFEAEPVHALRVNPLKMNRERLLSLAPFPLTPIPFAPNGFYYEYDKIGNHPLHHAGAIYAQEPAAMAPLSCLPIEADWKILDLCASPGGKSTQAAGALQEGGVVVSNEISPSRCGVLTQNAERLGLRHSVITNTDSEKLAAAYPGFFDLVIVDAPCCGEGMMRKNEKAVAAWSMENVTMCAQRQRQILSAAVETVRQGGYLLYCTCTFSTEENEENVDWLLTAYPEFSLSPVNPAVAAHTSDGVNFPGCRHDLSLCRRFYPHISPGEGQFMALLRRSADAAPQKSVTGKEKPGKCRSERGSSKQKENPDFAAVRAFLKETLACPVTDSLHEEKDGFYLCPEIPLPTSGVFSPGVPVGSVQKARVIPHHRFFMAYGKDFCRQIELTLDDPRVSAYLHGDVIESNTPDGWACVCIEGCPVGGAKVVSGVAKNFYPKGLRRPGA